MVVEELKKSGSPRMPLKRKESIVGKQSPGKNMSSSPSRVKSKSSMSLDKRGPRLSESTNLSVSQLNEENPEPGIKKTKIKSVKNVP